jgi:hypothetical protein
MSDPVIDRTMAVRIATQLGWEPKREWVGLTKDEVETWELPVSPTVYEFAQFVEAKLKEKNT